MQRCLLATTFLVSGCLAGARAQLDPGRACTQSDECVIVSRACCAPCTPPRRNQVMALSRAYLEAHGRPRCDGVGCPRCASRANPDLVPACVARQCTVIDVASPALSRCNRDDECTARATTCCAGCGPTPPDQAVGLRIRALDRFERLICERGHTECPECMAEPPPAGCRDHRCVVVPQ
jgi:hypothetical protein